ncbi:hypothetical protein ACV0BM_014715 [Elizabethkingia meningoseptica]
MDIITLASTAITLATPFLQKVGEGTSRKIGEDIWNLIKKPFSKKEKDADKLTSEELKTELINILNEDKGFKEELEKLVQISQSQLNSISQNIQNNADIQKQVNIGSNIGDINL